MPTGPDGEKRPHGVTANAVRVCRVMLGLEDEEYVEGATPTRRPLCEARRREIVEAGRAEEERRRRVRSALRRGLVWSGRATPVPRSGGVEHTCSPPVGRGRAGRATDVPLTAWAYGRSVDRCRRGTRTPRSVAEGSEAGVGSLVHGGGGRFAFRVSKAWNLGLDSPHLRHTSSATARGHCGGSSIGRARASSSRGYGFETRPPLHSLSGQHPQRAL